MRDRYQCDRCGACCRCLILEIEHIDVVREPRLVGRAEPHREPPLGWESDWERTYSLNDPKTLACVMIGPDNLCSIYPTRPNACVAFQAGDEQCQMARAGAGLAPLQPVSLTEVRP